MTYSGWGLYIVVISFSFRIKTVLKTNPFCSYKIYIFFLNNCIVIRISRQLTAKEKVNFQFSGACKYFHFLESFFIYHCIDIFRELIRKKKISPWTTGNREQGKNKHVFFSPAWIVSLIRKSAEDLLFTKSCNSNAFWTKGVLKHKMFCKIVRYKAITPRHSIYINFFNEHHNSAK